MATQLGTWFDPVDLSPEPGTAKPSSFVALRRLDWDTAFFGVLMGAIDARREPEITSPARRAEVLAADLQLALEQARAEGYSHLIYRIPADDIASTWAAESTGLKLVDVAVDSTFRFGTTPIPDRGDGPAIRPARAEDVPALREVAATAFAVSRFATDPFFSAASVSAFYQEWVTNLCNGLAQAVFVCEIATEVAGFVSCTMTGDEGRIPLIATRAGDRQRGVGRGLVATALRWFAEADARVAHVKTQSVNYPALALYHRAGFTVSRAELTFSIALDGNEHTRTAEPKEA